MKNTVLKNALLLLLLTLLSVDVEAQTNVSGFISANTTWTLAGSPYIVVSNALVSQGVTLTINPGVVVKLDSACALQVDGEMIAIGTESNRITFTSNKAIPQPGDWSELHFSDYAVDATFDNSGNYLSGCIMKYCDVEYGTVAIHIESSSPYFSHCNINHSGQGLYCNGSSCLIDSSVVDSCGSGIQFSNVALNSCGVIIRSDTIKNSAGGILIEDNPGCTTIINNNYLISNRGGEILFANVRIGEITGNYFIDNTSYAGISLVSISGDSVLISGNSFINNIDSDFDGDYSILLSIYGNSMILDNSFINNKLMGSFAEIAAIVSITNSNCKISDNSFINDSIINNTSPETEGVISIQGGTDTIECNLFLNNDILNGSEEGGSGCLNLNSRDHNNIAVISNNIFDGNINNDSTNLGASVAWINGGITTFRNNIIRSNSSLSNACCVFNPILNTNNPLLLIEQNNFINNVSKDIIYLSGGNTSNATYNFLYMKNNNFNDPAAQYELYNNIPYGSPDIYPDSNYWGSLSTQHIDSVIFDYFDNEALSVVYYQPILTAPVVIDTTCSGGFTTGIKNVDQAVSSTAFPNPFSNSTEVLLGKELQDAEVMIYNVFGQKMRSIEQFSGNELIIDRGNLSSGVYIYTIVEKQAIIANGKLVVE